MAIARAAVNDGHDRDRKFQVLANFRKGRGEMRTGRNIISMILFLAIFDRIVLSIEASREVGGGFNCRDIREAAKRGCLYGAKRNH